MIMKSSDFFADSYCVATRKLSLQYLETNNRKGESFPEPTKRTCRPIIQMENASL